MFALVVRFEVKEESVAEFDALVSTTLEGIRSDEDGTLMYFSSAVSDDPCSRIFVELYRDEEAFQAHEERPHTRNFLSAREDLLDSYRVEFLSPRDGKFPAW
jgi:quinol monooxygenase YgiN